MANGKIKRITKPERQLLGIVFCIIITVWLAGGSLVKAETVVQSRQSDRFVGFHIVVGMRSSYDENWVEYGQTEWEVGEFGAVQIPDMVLFGAYQADTGEWIFPGMPGNNAFYTTCGAEEEGLSTGYAGLHANVEIGFSSHLAEPYLHTLEDSDAKLTSVVDDTRDSISLSGTVYLPATQEDQFVTYYRVYETADGRIYLDGSGNSSGGKGIGGFGMGSTEEVTLTANGDTYTVTTEVWVDVEYVYPCTALVLLEYSAQNECIASTLLATESQEITLNADTSWCVVQETDATGLQRNTALSVADASESGRLYHGFVTQTQEDSIHSESLEIIVS